MKPAVRAVALFVAVIAFALLVSCVTVAVNDDDSLAPLRDRGCREKCQDNDGDRKGNRYCFMPCDFTIIVPVPTPSGGGPEEEQAALFPPDPARLAQAVQTGAEGIGKAAGALAGAIAALPASILL